MSERGSKVGGAQSEKLLPQIEVVSMLRGKDTPGGDTFDISEHQAAGRKWNDSLHITEAE